MLKSYLKKSCLDAHSNFLYFIDIQQNAIIGSSIDIHKE